MFAFSAKIILDSVTPYIFTKAWCWNTGHQMSKYIFGNKNVENAAEKDESFT